MLRPFALNVAFVVHETSEDKPISAVANGNLTGKRGQQNDIKSCYINPAGDPEEAWPMAREGDPPQLWDGTGENTTIKSALQHSGAVSS